MLENHRLTQISQEKIMNLSILKVRSDTWNVIQEYALVRNLESSLGIFLSNQ